LIVDIAKHRGKVNYSWYIGCNLGMNPSGAWEGSDFRVLIVFFSSGAARAQSRTYQVLEEIIRSDKSRNYFVDYCHFPDEKDAKYFIKNKIPFIFGNVSKRTVEDYDVVLFSVALYTEVQKVPSMLYFSGIPLEHETRLKDFRYPLFILGGMGTSSTEILCGGEGGGMLDLVLYGQAEGVLSQVLQLFQKATENHKDYHDPDFKFGMIAKIVSGFRCAYYPAGYIFEIGGDSGVEVLSVTKKYSWLPDKVYANHIEKADQLCVGGRRIFAPDNTNANLAELAVSYGCTGYGACNFCLEGNICGKWLELPYEKLENLVQDIKRNSAPNCVPAYSFNTLYVSYFYSLILLIKKNFSSTVMRNFRTDAVSGSGDLIPFLRAAGCKQFSLPIEGVGERIRNVFLNKGLSFEQIKSAFKNLFLNGVGKVKVNMVWTGYETHEDVDNFVQELKVIADLRDQYSPKAFVCFVFTSLVIHNDVPLRWCKRFSAIQCVQSGGWTDVYSRFHKKVGELGFSSKRTKAQYGVAWEQTVIDYGRVLTSAMKELCKDPDFFLYGNMGKQGFEKALSSFKKHHLPDMVRVFDAERPFDFGFPSPVVQMTSVDHSRNWYERVVVRGVPQSGCLRTASNLDSKCFGCGLCKTKEEVHNVTKRELEKPISILSLQKAQHENRIQSAIRVVLCVHPELRELGKQNLSHFVASQFIQNSSQLLEAFHSVGNYSSPSTSGFSLDWFYGKMFFDLFLRKGVEITQETVDRVNTNLELCSVSSFRQVVPRSRGKAPSALYLFYSEVSTNKYKQGYAEYSGVLREQGSFSREGSREGREISFSKKDLGFHVEVCPSGSRGALFIPTSFTPQLVLSNLIRGSERKVLEQTLFQCVDIYNNSVSLSCACGNFKHFSETTGEVAVACPMCIARALLRRLS